jgi:hypothetical protein
MRISKHSNKVRVQNTEIPMDMSLADSEELARGISLYYKDKKFTGQTFFTQPIVGEINWIEGLEKDANVHFRSVNLIGPNLFHVRLVGREKDIMNMCEDKTFYEILHILKTTLNDTVRSRRFIEVNGDKESWNVITSLEKKRYCIVNRVLLDKKHTHIENLLMLGDRIIGLTPDRKVVLGHITPEIFESNFDMLKVNLMDDVNKLGKVDMLGLVPNSEDSFLVTIGRMIYQIDIWGDMLHFNELEDDVKKINSVNFNHTRTIMATNNGLYEMDVMEMPNMVKATGMPRKIADRNLIDNFQMALYVDDPKILGISPAIGVFAKTTDKRVLFF